MSAASDDFPPPEDEPTRALLLAQALDVCISAERSLPGSADHIIAHQPTWAREELRRLVSLAGSLDAVSTSAVMSDEFRVAARTRLLQRVRGGTLRNGTHSAAAEDRWPISAFPSTNGYHVPAAARGRKRRWLWRTGVGGLLAAALATAATLTASASALPGEPLYSIKQAQEELGLRLAPDDQARTLALLNQGDARLNETARLLQAGRTGDIAQTTRRFDEAISLATTTFVVTIADAPTEAPTTTSIETKLSAQQAQLESLISSAPEPARADLRQALMATERGLALVADTQADQSVDRGATSQSSVVAAVPTTAAEAIPTVEQPKVVVQVPQRPSTGVVADRHDANSKVTDQPQGENSAVGETPVDAAPPPSQPQVAVGREAHGEPAITTPGRGEPARASTSDDQKDDQHFEPVATDSGAVAQAPQVSQGPAPRHLDITLSHDSEPASAKPDARQDDERQVVVPSTRADDHAQVEEQQPQPSTAHAQGASQSTHAASNDDATASANGPGTNTSRTQATNASDQHSTGSHGEDSHPDNANTNSSSSSHGSSNGDEHGGKGGGGGDHNAKSTTDQNSKSGGDSSHGH